MKHNNFNKYDVPENLKEHIFYGLTLDEDQKIFRDALWDKNKLIVVCNAKSGSGKSTISLGVANLLCEYGLYDGIVYIMSPTMEQKQGYIPGDVTQKNAPYIEPLLDAIITLGLFPTKVIKEPDTEWKCMSGKNNDGYIEFTTHTYMRGINIENKVVIIEEAQNWYQDEMRKALTRIHDNCKTIIIGHTEQCDLLKNKSNSGFSKYIDYFKELDDDRIAICELRTNHRGWVSSICDVTL